MRAIRLGWHEMLAVLGGCVLVAGCQGPRPHLATLAPPREDAPSLNAAQKADLRITFARSLEKSGALEQATAAYQDALKQDPNCADALDRLAVLHAKKGQFEEAVLLHKKALALQPRNADFLCDLGYCYYLQQRWAEAETQFRKTIDLAPDHLRAHNNLGLVLAHSHRGEEALAAFRNGGCSDADAHSNLAFALTLENSWQAAQQHYARAHQLDPASVPAEKGLRIVNARIEGIEKTISQGSSKPASLSMNIVSPLSSPVPEPVLITPPPSPRGPASLPAPTPGNILIPPAPTPVSTENVWITPATAPSPKTAEFTPAPMPNADRDQIGGEKIGWTSESTPQPIR